MTLPDVIFGVGGAGKEMLFTILQQEWFLRKIVEDRRVGKINKEITAIVIDTAIDEYPDDKRNGENIERKISEILIKSGVHLNPSDILDLRIICIPREINVERVSDLIAIDVIRKVKNSEILKNIFDVDEIVWWLEDADSGLKGWFDLLKILDPSVEMEFTRGVFRKRAISKALFYRLLAERGLDLKTPNKVAILLGLGGGTGSGIFIDLATYIYRRFQGVPIDVFAVLPTKEELDDEKANAFAALMELEYLRLKDRRLFQSIILLPFDPTGYIVSRAQDPSIKNRVKEFDTVVAYVFYNFYVGGRIGGADLFNRLAPLKYAQFLLATGTIVKYEIENLFSIKNLIRLAVEAINDFTNFRKDINRTLSLLLNDFRSVLGESERIPPKHDYDYINTMIEKLELWNYKALNVLKYATIDEIRETLRYTLNDDLKSKNNFDMLIKYIEICERVLDSIKGKPEFQPKDEVDRQLPEVLYKAFKELREAGNLIRLYSNINFEERLRRFIEKLVRAEAPSGSEEAEFSRYMRELEDKILEIDNKIKNLDRDLATLNEEEKKVKEDVKNFIITVDKTLNDVWEIEQLRRFADKDLEHISQLINDFIVDIKTKFVEEIDEEDRYIAGEKDWLNRIGFGDIEGTVREIAIKFHSFEDIKLETEIIELIRKIALSFYYYNMKEYYKYRAGRSRFRRKRYEEWMRTFEGRLSGILNEIRKSEFPVYYDSSGLPESVSLRDEVVRRITVRRNSYISELSEKINRKLNVSIDDDIIRILELSDSRIGFKDAVEDKIINAIIDLRKIHERREKIKIEISKFREELVELQELLDVTRRFNEQYPTLRRNIDGAVALWNKFLDNIRKANEKMEERVTWDKETYTYISKISPDASMVGALGGSIENLTLDNILKTDKVSIAITDAEIDRIIGKCRSWIDRISSDETYNGISLPYIEYQTNAGRGRWCPTIVYLCISDGETIIGAMEKIKDDLIESINRGLSLIDRRYVKLFPSTEASGDFDVAILLYVAPIFLENIGNVGGDRGYKYYYNRKKERIIAGRKIPNILHHALMLEKGKIIRRTDLMELKKSAELAWKEVEEGNDVSEYVLENYEEIKFGGLI